MVIFTKYRKGWFRKAKQKWYYKNIKNWSVFSTGSFSGKLSYKNGIFYYRSGIGFNNYEYYYELGHERAFWLSRRNAKKQKDCFCFMTYKQFEEKINEG